MSAFERQILRSTHCRAVAIAALLVCVAANSSALAQSCGATLQRTDVVRCVLAASLAVRREHDELAVREGRRMAVSPLLPSNPELTLSAAHRYTREAQGLNWSASLSQELEIGGQRSARQQEAGAWLQAQRSAIVATERNVAAEAWRAYFVALAARDALAAATRLEQIFAQSSRAAGVGAEQGLVSGVDAELADLTVLRLSQLRIEAEERDISARSTLASLLGRDPGTTPEVQGELTPLRHVSLYQPEQIEQAIERRSEVRVAKSERESREAARSTLERSRMPNIRLSLLAQRDGFAERVLGGGVSLPIPLPYPVGRTYLGEIAESNALLRQAESEMQRVERAVRLEIIHAFQRYQTAKAQHDMFTPERVENAERHLNSIAGELRGGRISIADIVVVQQTLIEFLRNHIESDLALCLASIELSRAAGLALEGAEL